MNKASDILGELAEFYGADGAILPLEILQKHVDKDALASALESHVIRVASPPPMAINADPKAYVYIPAKTDR